MHNFPSIDLQNNFILENRYIFLHVSISTLKTDLEHESEPKSDDDCDKLNSIKLSEHVPIPLYDNLFMTVNMLYL